VLSGATDGPTLEFTPGAAGAVTLQLALTDDRGLSTASDVVIAVAAASGAGGGGGGGGSSSPAWLAALALAAWQLRRRD
jgi:hypothetical protein